MPTEIMKKRRMRTKHAIRAKISGTAERPRLSVYRSNSHIYAQLIDDLAGRTLASSSSKDKAFDTKSKPVEMGRLVGKLLAERAKAAGIEAAVFDRNGYRYHGRVQALAEGAREGGLRM